MKILATVILALAGGAALLFGGYLLRGLLWLYCNRSARTEIHYSEKQIDVLTDTAKALIPTVAGFAVLAASGAGYLYTHGELHSAARMLATFSVFGSIVVSVACWIYLFGMMVDCSKPFDRLNDKLLSPELSTKDISRVAETYTLAVTFAKIACVAFFYALDISLLIAVQVFFN